MGSEVEPREPISPEGGNTRGSSNPLLAAPQITSELEGVDKISRRCTSGSWRYGRPRDSPGPSAPRGIGTSRNFGRLVGEEVYGKFLLDVLEAEGINVVGMLENTDASPCRQAYETLLCWVLVDPFQRHGFCSRADFSEEPAFSWIRKLPAETKIAIHHSKILFCNGYAFDEFFPDVIASAIDCAIDAGTTVFFDPRPRGKSLLHGTLDEQRALEHSLKLSNVLLLTSDEEIPKPISPMGTAKFHRGGRHSLHETLNTKYTMFKYPVLLHS